MLVSQKALNNRYIVTSFFRTVAEKKRRCLAEEEARAWKDMALTAYGVPLFPVTSFQYLGQVLVAEDNNWPEVVCNLRRDRQKWEFLTRILSRKGVDSRTSSQIYLAVVQLVMIYSSES